MQTIYYTLTARHIAVSGDTVARAAGDDRRCLVFTRTPAPGGTRGKVIDLEQRRALRETALEDRPDAGEVSETVAAPRPRRTRRDLSSTLELLATLSVVAVTALLALRLLLF